MAQGLVKVFRIRIRYNGASSPAELVEVDATEAIRDTALGDQSAVESWIRQGNAGGPVRAGDEFVVVYSTAVWDPNTPMQNLAHQAGSTVLGWQPATYWAFYD